MGRVRTVAANKVKVTLSDGDWVEIKEQLNVGEQKQLEAAGLKPALVEGKLFNVVDWAVHDQERALIFLVDWSFKDENDKDLPINRATIDALEPETLTEINKAISSVVQAALEKKLNSKKTKSNGSGTSPESEPS